MQDLYTIFGTEKTRIDSSRNDKFRFYIGISV